MRKLYLHCLALSSLLAATAIAQQNETPALSPPTAPAPKSTEGRIHLDVVVTDKSGKPIPGLDQSDFTLLDNSQPAKILSFKAMDGTVQKADPPVEVILLIDAVNADVQETNIVRDQTKKFLLGNDGHLTQPVSVFVLTEQGLSILAPPSVDGKELAQKVGQLVFGTHTIQSAGVYGAMRMFDLSLRTLEALSKSEARKPGKKLLIWFGSGWPMFDSDRPPTPSNAQLQQCFDQIVQLSTQLRAARISVYSILWESFSSPSLRFEDYLKGVKTASKANTADLSLKVLAVQTGGRIVGPDNHLDLAIYSVVQDAGAFYTLSFDAPRADGPDEYHDLKVIIDKPKLTARTSTGYYNQPDAAPGPANDLAASNVDASRLAEPAGKPATVEQLEQALKDAHGQPDAETARQLSGLVLTERLSSAKLSALKAGLPGAKAQQALVALADTSVFLNPPSAEIPTNVAPDLTEQRRIMAQVIDYLNKTLPKLPNFFATRTTAHYEEHPPKSEKPGTENPGGPLHLTDTSNATVLYREGHEVVQPDIAKGKKPRPQAERLVIKGTFGPILFTVIEDAPGGHLKWSRWEQGAQGPVGVFQFAVPRKESHYYWNDASSLFAVGIDELQQSTAYHGEIAVDPATGVILRLVMEADREPGSPRIRADIMVEYGPVEIGGKTYFCPVRSVSLSRESPSSPFSSDTKPILGPAMTMLNDVAFGDYHMFRSEVKLLSGDDPLPDAK